MLKELISEISPNIIKYDYTNDILKIHDDILNNETGNNINLQPKTEYTLIFYFKNKNFKSVSYKAYYTRTLILKQKDDTTDIISPVVDLIDTTNDSYIFLVDANKKFESFFNDLETDYKYISSSIISYDKANGNIKISKNTKCKDNINIGCSYRITLTVANEAIKNIYFERYHRYIY